MLDKVSVTCQELLLKGLPLMQDLNRHSKSGCSGQFSLISALYMSWCRSSLRLTDGPTILAKERPQWTWLQQTSVTCRWWSTKLCIGSAQDHQGLGNSGWKQRDSSKFSVLQRKMKGRWSEFLELADDSKLFGQLETGEKQLDRDDVSQCSWYYVIADVWF